MNILTRMKKWLKTWKQRHSIRYFLVPEKLFTPILFNLRCMQAYELSNELENCESFVEWLGLFSTRGDKR